MQKEFISLKELLVKVKDVITSSFDTTYWICADISDFHEDITRGHCYLELVEKNDKKLIEAKVRAAIWANTYRFLKPYFEQQTGQSLRTGMKVLAEVSVTFHELYGLSCVILNIDPTFTIGDMARKKQETIQQLKEDGVWEMNKQVEMPFLIKRIAVISSASAAGFGDFCHQLQSNDRGFQFSFQLFPATMQGEHAAESIIEALDRVFEQKDQYDVVVIIRGGGATTDLLAFDEYDLAYVVAQFPLPILTGIGHERDESVVDMVAHTRCKTPTAVAAFIYEKMLMEETHLLDLEENIKMGISSILEGEKVRLNELSACVVRDCSHRIMVEEQSLTLLDSQLRHAFQERLSRHIHHVELMENTLLHISPEAILRRGYSITTVEGKVLRSVSQVKKGSELRTVVSDGEVRSVVK